MCKTEDRNVRNGQRLRNLLVKGTAVVLSCYVIPFCIIDILLLGRLQRAETKFLARLFGDDLYMLLNILASVVLVLLWMRIRSSHDGAPHNVDHGEVENATGDGGVLESRGQDTQLQEKE